jgi:DNA/RNA-binding domain of Phe-tRNA-synthetase-like protein
LGLDIITSEKSEEILELIEQTLTAIEGEILVSDDHGPILTWWIRWAWTISSVAVM